MPRNTHTHTSHHTSFQLATTHITSPHLTTKHIFSPHPATNHMTSYHITAQHITTTNTTRNHNMKITNADNNANAITKEQCNCRKKDQCPLDNKCLTSSVIYNAQVTTNNTTKNYIGLTEGTFKQRSHRLEMLL